MEECGLVSLDHPWKTGLEEDAPELRAALERAIFHTRVHWYCHSMYGVAPEGLSSLTPARDVWEETYEQRAGEPQEALDRLKDAIADFGAALSAERVERVADAVPKQSESGLPDTSRDKVLESLKTLGTLHDEGVLTDEEFARKKEELLKQI